MKNAARIAAVPALALVAFAGSVLMPTTTPQATAAAAAQSSGFSVDAGHSGVLFKILHLGVANFYGRFNGIDGTFDLTEGGSIDITIDANSVDTNSEGRDNHLRSEAFFNVAQFPSATFKSSSIRATGENTFEVTGDLTIRGTTEEISFTATKTGEGDRGPRFGFRTGFETSFTISRSAFGVSYLPEGLGDEVEMIISLEGVRQ